MESQASIKKIIKRICDLQRLYSSEATEPMKERGRLIRRDLAGEIRLRADHLAGAMGAYGADFDVGASDGITRKTEAPWVRFYSRTASPTPRDGYYAVIHFERDGSAVYLTLGCGSTVWENGMLRSLPDAELVKRTEIARKIIRRENQSVSPFTDVIRLGAKAPLTKTFEKATVIAKRVTLEEIDTADLDGMLSRLAYLLCIIYEAQSTGADLTPADQDQLQIKRWEKLPSAKAQGYGLSSEERKAVEACAMKIAREYWTNEDYEVIDCSANNPFDLIAKKGSEEIKIEVKGTTSLKPTAILMTKNEVDLHRDEKQRTALVIVSEIELARKPIVAATGGVIEVLDKWEIDEWLVTPTMFRVERK